MFKKLKSKIAIGLTFAMVGGLLGPADGAFSKKAYAAGDEPKDLGNIIVDVSKGEHVIDLSDKESAETKFVIAAAFFGETEYETHTEDGVTYTDIDGDGFDDIYSYSLEDGNVAYGECEETRLVGSVDYITASDKLINVLKSTGDDYYSGMVIIFSEPLGDYAINYSSSGESINLTTSSSMEERRIEAIYLNDTFEEIFGSGGSGAEYLLKETTESSVSHYYLDFDKDNNVDVIVCFEPYYRISTYYLSKTCSDKTFEFNTTSGKKKVYKNISFKIPNKTFEFNMSKLAIDFTLNHSDTYRLTSMEKETYGYIKSIEMALGANMEYCAKTGLKGVKVLNYRENEYADLDFDGDGKTDVIINWSFYGGQTVEFVSETICNKTIELTFPDTIKGYKKITFKLPATLGYGWGEKVIDFKNDLGYLTSDSDFTNVMNFLSFTKAMNKKSDMFDLDGDGTTDITIYGGREALVMPTESSNLLGKEYTISYTDEYLKEQGFKSFNSIKFIFPDKYTNYIEYDAARGNYSDEYFKYLYAAMGCFSHVKTSVDTSDLDSAGNGKLTVYYYHTDGVVSKGLKDPSTPDLIGYFNVKNYMRTGFTVNGKFEKTADSYYTGDNVVLDFSWTGTLYKGVKLSFKADIKDIVVPEIGKVEIVNGKAVPDLKLTYKDRELVEGEDYTVTYENNDKPGIAKAIIIGKGLFEGKLVIQFEVVEKKADKPSNANNVNEVADGPKEGTTVKDSDYVYKVTKAGSTNGKIVGEVKVVKLNNKKLKSVKVEDVVTINKVKYKVTAIGNKAFKKNKNITKVVIGKNVKTIGNSAFEGCKKLKLVNIKSKKLTKIGKKAFAKCKILTKMVIKSNLLKKVGNGAVKGTSKNLVIKAPKKKKSAYEEKFKKAGNKKVKAK